jgi:hypothetical protein
MSPLNKFLNYSVGFSRRQEGKAEGRRQEAGGKGRRQEAGGRRERQKAEGRRQEGKTEGRRQEGKAEGRRQEAGGGRERRIITLLQPIDRSYIAAAITLRTDQTAETT